MHTSNICICIISTLFCTQYLSDDSNKQQIPRSESTGETTNPTMDILFFFFLDEHFAVNFNLNLLFLMNYMYSKIVINAQHDNMIL